MYKQYMLTQMVRYFTNIRSQLSFLPTGNGVVKRWLREKVGDHINIKDYGADGTAVKDMAAITAMATDYGYVVYPSGNYNIGSNYSILVPQFFLPGASLTIAPAATLTIYNRIVSPDQYIFKGDGKVLFNIAANIGEDSRTIMAGWFGIFPTNRVVDDVTARIQRALDSHNDQSREGILQFQSGSYHVSNTMYVPRGTHIACIGTRRTIFDVSGPGDTTIFETMGNACKFTNFQFEYPTGEDKVRTAPYIHVRHNTCEIEDVWLFPSTVGIIVDEQWCTIRGLRATYGLDPKSTSDTDTSMVWVRASNTSIFDVTQFSTTYSPHHIIRVGSLMGSIASIKISDIHTSLQSNSVYIDARVNSVTRVEVDGIMSNPAAGALRTDAVIMIKTAGSSIVQNITLSNLIGNDYVDNLLYMLADGTSIISNVVLGNATMQGITGYGVSLINIGTGAIRNVSVADDVDVSLRTVRYRQQGRVSANIPASLKGGNYASVDSANTTIANNDIFVISDNRETIFSANLILGSSNSKIGGLFSFRAAGTGDHITPVGVVGSLIDTTTATLTGTTGAVGRVTIGPGGPGKLIIENRSGSSVIVTTTILTGN